MEWQKILASEKYRRATKRQLRELENRLIEHSFPDGEPDYRSFPMHKKGDLILILKPEGLYTPEIDPWPNITHHVSRHSFKNVDFLKNTIAEVIGYSDIYYSGPMEADMKLKCIDDEVRFMDAFPDEENPDFIFVPHPKDLDDFEKFMEHYVGKERKSEVKRLLKREFKKLKFEI